MGFRCRTEEREIEPAIKGQNLLVDEVSNDIYPFLGECFDTVKGYLVRDAHYDNREMVRLDLGSNYRYFINLWKENVDGEEMTVVEVLNNYVHADNWEYRVSGKFYFSKNYLVSATAVVIYPENNLAGLGAYTISIEDKDLILKYYNRLKLDEMIKRHPEFKKKIIRAGVIEELLESDSELNSFCEPDDHEWNILDVDRWFALNAVVYVAERFEKPSLLADGISAASALKREHLL